MVIKHRCQFCNRPLNESKSFSSKWVDQFCSPLCYQSDIQMKLGLLTEEIGRLTPAPAMSGPSGGGDKPIDKGPIQLTVDYTGTQFDFTYKLPSTKAITLNWGDGTNEEFVGQDSTIITKTSNYSETGSYNFWVEGDVTELTYLAIGNNSSLRGNINFTNLIKLTSITLFRTSIGFDISTLKNLTSLTFINCDNNDAVYGDASELRMLTNLRGLLTAMAPKVTFESSEEWINPSSSHIIWRIGGGLTSRMIDNAIKAWKNNRTTSLHILDTTPRTSASNDDLFTLLGSGSSIILPQDNITTGITFGSELHTGSNAVSDPNGNESNTLTGWSSTGLGSPNVFEVASGSGEVYSGSYSFKVDATLSPSANCNIYQTYTLVSESFYRLDFDWKHLGTPSSAWSWRPNNIYYNHVIAYEDYIPGGWQGISYWFKSGVTSYVNKFQENSLTNNGGIYLDNVSMRNVTLP